jgi:hypothetical protein
MQSAPLLTPGTTVAFKPCREQSFQAPAALWSV